MKPIVFWEWDDVNIRPLHATIRFSIETEWIAAGARMDGAQTKFWREFVSAFPEYSNYIDVEMIWD